MNSILLIGSVQSLFLVILLISKRGRSFSDSFLAVWLTHIGLHLLIYYLYELEVMQVAAIMNLNAALPLMQGPYLYFYVRTLAENGFRWRPRHLLHLLPAGCFALFTLFALSVKTPHGATNISVFEVTTLFTLAILVSVPVYISLSFLHIRRYNQALREVVSSTSGVDLVWLRNILLGMSMLWIVVIVLNVPRLLSASGAAHDNSHVIFLLLTVFIYAIGYLGIRQRNTFSELLPSGTLLEADGNVAKYKRSGLGEAEAAAIATRLQKWMEEKKPYLDETLTLKLMSDELSIPANTVSQVINQQFGKNFYEFVNGYRVQEFIALRSDPESGHLTILTLALDSGFSSKASFNRVFKKLTGKAPSQYQY